VLREKSGLDGDGVPLVGQALGGEAPRLRINKLQTETERNVQRGLQDILRGIYRAVRNPRSHEQTQDDKDTADSIIYFINYLLSILAESQEPFTTPRFLSSVFDPDFVESSRYSELLAAEIPARRRAEVLIEIFRRKREGEGSKLRFIIRAILDLLTEDQVEGFLAVVSEDLKTTRDATDIRIIFQVLPPELWPQIDEVARLRTENKLLHSIREGELDPIEERPLDGKGALGTWARRFLEYFGRDSRREAWSIFDRKLASSDRFERDYVVKYFIRVLPQVCDTSYKRDRCVKVIEEAVRAGEYIMRSKLPSAIPSFPQDWQDEIRESLTDLKESDPDFYWRLLEIPF
jgi:uncharacterized protein (TIGR02391 family)